MEGHKCRLNSLTAKLTPKLRENQTQENLISAFDTFAKKNIAVFDVSTRSECSLETESGGGNLNKH